ncbi:hypothetical protein Hypma_013746 [Hypsizygus marmoreus]|uniref:Uncharacterized protein n=1 Tax=Hypsizygus marmoreus TaxID=39966 RepID=A0A369KAQ5_HYPMA|nr:hypothetical protein Hypma_013746 [Hypsizygus marmoreus]
MLKLCRSSTYTLYSSHSKFELGALHLGIRRCQNRYNAYGDQSSDSSETIKSTTAIKPKVARRRRVISTLDPSRLQDSDFLDLSNGITSASLIASAATNLIPHAASSLFPQIPRTTVQFYYYGGAVPRKTFPTDARGFLYYHRDPELPPISGAVRFRLMPESCTTGVEEKPSC